jgi:shikimate dehydrogenase
MKKFAVLGNPIQHSLSPYIHEAFAAQINETISYTKILIKPSDFNASLHGLLHENYCGVNVTLPFKGEAASIANFKSEEVVQTGSANTLSFNNHAIHADTTDGVGLIQDLEKKIGSLKASRVLILGAGGAANAVIPSLNRASINKLFLWNRTIEKSHAMESLWQPSFNNNLSVMEDIDLKDIDVVINATAASIHSNASPIPLGSGQKGTICYDMMYGKQTPFLEEALSFNMKAIDGLGMLIRQAAAIFKIWHQTDVNADVVENAIRKI